VDLTPDFFFIDRACAFFFLRAILTYARTAAGGTAGTRGSWRSGARDREGGRARQGGRMGVEKSRGVGGEGTESDVEGRNCRCKVVGRFAYMQSLNLYLQS